MSTFQKVPTDLLSKIQLGAGVVVANFDTAQSTYEETDLIGATSGGVKIEIKPTYTDFGDDIDNVPNNTMELKRLDSWEAKMSGTFVSMDAPLAKKILAAADTAQSKVTLRTKLKQADFADVWFVGEYSDGDTTSGYMAVKLSNSLSTGGFSLTTSDDKKGTFPFEFTAHYSLSSIDTVPAEIYIKAGA